MAPHFFDRRRQLAFGDFAVAVTVELLEHLGRLAGSRLLQVGGRKAV
jgi:hypothetical protein